MFVLLSRENVRRSRSLPKQKRPEALRFLFDHVHHGQDERLEPGGRPPDDPPVRKAESLSERSVQLSDSLCGRLSIVRRLMKQSFSPCTGTEDRIICIDQIKDRRRRMD